MTVDDRTEQVIRVATKWWTDQLRGQPKYDNGEPFHGAMASMIRHKPIEEEKLAAFEEILGCALAVSLTFDGGFRAHVNLGVDYHPDGFLRRSLEYAGIDGDWRLPWKTAMHVHPAHVALGHGYKAPWVNLIDLRTREERRAVAVARVAGLCRDVVRARENAAKTDAPTWAADDLAYWQKALAEAEAELAALDKEPTPGVHEKEPT